MAPWQLRLWWFILRTVSRVAGIAYLLIGILLGLLISSTRGPTGNCEQVRYVQIPTVREGRLQRDSFGILYTLGLTSPIIEVYRARYNGGRGPYLEELLRSLQSVRKHSPGVPVALVTDSEDNLNATTAALFDKIIIQKEKVFVTWGDVIPAVLASPWRRTLFLDLDILVCADVKHMFSWLENYDIGVVAEPYLFSHARGALLNRKPQAITWNSLNNWNTGMLLYDNNARVRKFFNEWNAAYNYPGGSGGGDQEAFMQLLERSDVRVKQLPAEYNLRVHTNTLPHFLTSEVKILHSRYETCQSVNQVVIPRLFDHLKGRVVYTWELDEREPENRPVRAVCAADRTEIAPNIKVHKAVVADQLEVP